MPGTRSVDTIANLKAVNTASLAADTSNNTVLVLGYYAAGDGGGGYFQFVSSSALADDGGGVIAPNAGGGRWLRRLSGDEVSVQQWGARGDASADDTARIQAAINYASANDLYNVFFPAVPDAYRVTATLTVPADMSLRGAGYASCIRMTTLSGTAPDITHPNIINITGSNVLIESLRITANNSVAGYYPSTSGNSCGIQTNGTALDNITVRNCYIHGVIYQGINMVARSNVSVTGNTLWENNGGKSCDINVVGNGSTGQVFERIRVCDNHCLSNCDLGINIGGGNTFAKDIVVTGNHIVTLTQGAEASAANCQRRHGILLAYSGASGTDNRAVVSDNIIRHTKWTGMYVNDGTNGSGVGPYAITGNLITDIGYEPGNSISGGISMVGSGKGDVVSHNRILRTYNNTPGIKITHSQNTGDDKTVLVAHNVLTECTTSALNIGIAGHNVEVTGNVFRNNIGSDLSIGLASGSTLEHKVMIVDNVFHRSNINSPSLDLDQQSSTCVLWVHRNQFFGPAIATNTWQNSAVYCRQRFVVVRENFIKGFYFGVNLVPFVGNREPLMQVDDNQFENVTVGIRGDRTTSAPVLPCAGNTFTNVATKGWTAVVLCKRNPTAVTQYASAAPTGGTWVAGDIVYNAAPAVGQPVGWMRTGAGTWRSMGNLA
jgi:hypothetical protein